MTICSWVLSVMSLLYKVHELNFLYFRRLDICQIKHFEITYLSLTVFLHIHLILMIVYNLSINSLNECALKKHIEFLLFLPQIILCECNISVCFILKTRERMTSWRILNAKLSFFGVFCHHFLQQKLFSTPRISIYVLCLFAHP